MRIPRIPLPNPGSPKSSGASWKPAWHARRQMAQDAWCLVLGICNFSKHQVHGQGSGEALRSDVWPVALDHYITRQNSPATIRVARNT